VKEGHRVLVVDDDPGTVKTVTRVLKTQGFEVRVATCVKAALEAIEEEDFCLLIVDQQLPYEDGDEPVAFAGETILRAARKKDARHTDDGLWFRLQLVALTGYSREAKYATRVHQAGADVFVEKPIASDESIEELIGVVRECLSRAGRKDHAQCLAAAPPKGEAKALPPKPEPAVRLAVDGARKPRRSLVKANGRTCEMEDAIFRFLVRLVANHLRAPDTYMTRAELGIGDQRHLVTDLHKALKDAIPHRYKVVEGDRQRRYRLNPEVLVEHVDWAKLGETHPDEAVKRLAREMLKLAGVKART
jgi:DNA-binding response OmpR family regulator